MTQNVAFQAEIKQILNILIHSLYKDREVFLRELVSNASDALNRVRFEMLTTDDVLDKDAELAITITVDEDENTIRISDTGIGMTEEEMVEGLGVIARSGARAFLDQADDVDTASEIIGQFGVGFYSVFMVAEKVEVVSRSYQPDAEAVCWVSTGDEGYEISPAEKDTRGTDIFITLREDAEEFASEWRLRKIIKRHSDYVNFPIYLHKAGEEDEDDRTPVNRQTALWRQSPDEVDEEAYHNFYSSLTLDPEPPRHVIHTRADAPLQFYSVLFVPHDAERPMFSPRQEPGIKLFARKVLIDAFNTDLLPEYLWFLQGVVDSEDLPLNVSRETIQDSPLVAKLRTILTRRVLDELQTLSEEQPEEYAALWHAFRMYLKHGAASDYANRERILPLLRFASTLSEDDPVTLDDYVEAMTDGQEAIYYVVADNVEAAARSMHLDPFKARGIPVLYMTDTIDGALIPNLGDYEGHAFVAVDADDLDLDEVGTLAEDEQAEAVEDDALADLLTYMADRYGERVRSVRASKVLTSGPVRLVTPAGALDRHQEQLYRMLDQEVEDVARILEVNPQHPLIHQFADRVQANENDPQLAEDVDMLYELALLADGVHPNPSTLASDLLLLLQRTTSQD